MQYLVKFMYDDGKNVDVALDEEQLQDFFRCLDAKQVYWADEERKFGMWLDLGKVRYVHLLKQEPADGKARNEGEDVPSDGELQDAPSGDSNPEGDSSPE